MYWLRGLTAVLLIFFGIISLVWNLPYINKPIAAIALCVGLLWAHFLPAGMNIDKPIRQYAKQQASQPIPLLRSPVLWLSLAILILLIWMFKF
ncbi:hypothetical protein [Kangiella sp. TOML190]|uniref:hypothetical protein n=1 Tax=Kangiella sp. TOML190 TaxID=2931351 RepID=UPI002041491E|nr:hypothetical protein [Kangiella sp. TOML190]